MTIQSISVGLTLIAAVAIGAALTLFGPEAMVVVPAVLGAAALLVRPLLGLLILALTIPFDAAIMVGGSTVTRLLAVAVAGLWFAHKVLRGDSWQRLLTTPLMTLGVLLVAWAGLSSAWADYPDLAQSGAIRLATFVALAVMVVDLVRSWKDAEWLVRVLVVGGIVAATLVISQYAGGGVRRAGDDVAGGINSTALLLVILLPFGFALVRRTQGHIWRWVGLAYVLVALAAVATTFTRMAFLLVPLVLLSEAWETLRVRSGRALIVILATAGVLAAIYFVPLDEVEERASTIIPYIEATLSGRSTDQPTMTGRGYHLYVALVIFQDHPVAGVGYENFGQQFLGYQEDVPGTDRLYRTPRSPHSSFTGILAELGMIGFLLWLALLGTMLSASTKAWRAYSDNRSSLEFLLVRGATLSLSLMIPYGFYAETHKDKLFWLISGAAVAIGHLARTKLPSNSVPAEVASISSVSDRPLSVHASVAAPPA